MLSGSAKYCLLSLIFVLRPVSPALAGKIYKWVDENGVTQFSTYPPLVQKPEQNVTTVKGVGTSSRSVLNREDLYGDWYVIERHQKHTLSLYKNSFSYRPQQSKSSWGLASSGDWKLDGGILEFTYKYHKDKNRQGTKETFFIKVPDETSLLLIAEHGNKRVKFRKDSDELRADKAMSRLAQDLIGFWQGVGGGDSISFSNETFELKGKRKQKFGANIHEAYGTKYSGRWSVDDPYITLEITLDEVYKLEGWRSKIGQEWRWLMVKHTPEMLWVRDSQTRRLKKFIKLDD